MDEHVFKCHEKCKQQNDILQKILTLQRSTSLIYCSIVGIKHAFYLFYIYGYVEINFYSQSLLKRNAIYGVWLSTISLTVCLFVISTVYNGISLAS